MDMTTRPGRENQSFGERTPVVAVGFALIAAGLAVLFYLGVELLAVYDEPAKHPFVVKISKAMAGAQIKIDKQTLSINEPFALGTAIVLLVMFAGLGISIASLLISSGGRMLSPEVHTELAKINIKLQEMSNQRSFGPSFPNPQD
ncbi:MAG: hypothetical protein OEZ55_05460 [Nitrospinota bacterium]|nr:hypothetical protein [Nitrospinota bacterium]MDH5756096.1 hypothetical protein [Nitrospinota bacterium]